MITLNKLIRVMLILNGLCYSVNAKTQTAYPDSLELYFKNPSASAKPYVWWHWMGSNFSKYGITKDLEAMKEEGIGGATIFNLSSAVQESHFPTLNNPWPNQTYRSAAYWEALKFAASEASRLGLEIGLHNTVGYSTTGGPWIHEEQSMQRLVWSDTTITGGKEVTIKLNAPKLIADEGWGKTGRTISFYKDIVVLAVPAEKKEILSSEIVTLTSQYNDQNGLTWNVPAGNWIIYRICHASTGRPPHPIPDDVLGKALEVDKMSIEMSKYHWKNVLEPVKTNLGEYVGKSFKHILIDSYEAGGQNWTANFRQEFMNRKGYDPVPWLASFSFTVGAEKDSKDRRIINSHEQTERFDWDYRDVISQLFFENGWKIGKEQLAKYGLTLQMEPYGGPFNTAQSVTITDLPMAEFWTAGIGGISPQVPAAARAAGKVIIGAEAFTGRPEVSRYTEDPAFLKSSADRVFAQGINRLILHHWVHQPFDDKYQPGMGMGWWGTHFGRHQTWFEPGKSFFQYLARCQTLLQYGHQVSDYLCVDKLKGYADLLSIPDFLSQQINIENGKIIMPSGRTYSFMVFSDSMMLPETVRKIKQLLSLGATIVAPKPFKSPSLRDYPTCDEELKQLSDEIWGTNFKTNHQSGHICKTLEEAVERTGVKKDFQVEQANSPKDVLISHRQRNTTDLYFISNQSDTSQFITVSFPIVNKQPELWQAEDGTISNALIWDQREGRTSVKLPLKGMQSVFVIFRKANNPNDHLISVEADKSISAWDVRSEKNGSAFLCSSEQNMFKLSYASGKHRQVKITAKPPVELTGSWKIDFVPKNDHKFSRQFSFLLDFSRHEDKMIRYFSGTANYNKIFYAGERSPNESKVLDLGEMNDIAEVRINDKRAGVLWYPPYRIDITDLLIVGKNKIEILVTNNWANRLIGDEQEPADFEWGKDRGEKRGRAMLAYPEWFINHQPRPSQGRKTFSVWYYYRNDSPLKPAGLVGPVRVISESKIKL